jgi:hypothetical protein
MNKFHDRGYKKLFSHPRLVEVLLKAFISENQFNRREIVKIDNLVENYSVLLDTGVKSMLAEAISMGRSISMISQATGLGETEIQLLTQDRHYAQ